MKPVYLDNNATTPLDPRVYNGMESYSKEFFGNPSSGHEYGYKTAAAILKSRKRIADLIHTKPLNILFTSGATESNNMVVLGMAMKYLPAFNKSLSSNEGIHIISSNVEHKCVLETCKRAEEWGAEITLLPVNKHGIIELEDLKNAIRPNTKLVSLIFANNEIGSLNPVYEIGALCRSKGIIFHTDAAQAAGKLDIDVDSMCIDLLSISGHKLYGPKGVGALYLRDGVEFPAITLGGGQEKGLRSGTHNVPGIVGLGLACEIGAAQKDEDKKRISEMSDWLVNEILTNVPGSFLNGHSTKRLYGNINLTFKGLNSAILKKELADISFSSASACSSAAVKPSHVLKAIGLSDEEAFSSVRFGLGRFSTWDEIKFVAEKVKAMSAKILSELGEKRTCF